MIAASIYTAELHTGDAVGGYGHSYVLAWISFVLSFLLAVTYLVLRKKSEWRGGEDRGRGWGQIPFEYGKFKKWDLPEIWLEKIKMKKIYICS